MTEEEKNREVAEIDARIQDLNAHRSMWSRAGNYVKFLVVDETAY